MSKARGQVFYKMTGSGNDFVMFDGRLTTPGDWPAERMARICDRQMGVGADGIVFLTPDGQGGVRMDYFNADGSPAAMCGNAALCSARLAAHLELAPPEGMTLLTPAGLMRTRCAGGPDLAELQMPAFQVPQPLTMEPQPGETGFFLGTVGVPHLIVLAEDAAVIDVARRGRELRFHPAVGPEGANVNFVSAPARVGQEPWLIRTYERGVEGETLACGTGTLAAAFALAAASRRALPSGWCTTRGIRLTVSGSLANGMASENWLCGEGRLVYMGVLR